jgi:hypothetical protein
LIQAAGLCKASATARPKVWRERQSREYSLDGTVSNSKLFFFVRKDQEIKTNGDDLIRPGIALSRWGAMHLAGHAPGKKEPRGIRRAVLQFQDPLGLYPSFRVFTNAMMSLISASVIAGLSPNFRSNGASDTSTLARNCGGMSLYTSILPEASRG